MPRIRAATVAAHKVESRKAILQAAARLFAGEGYDRTSLSDIAALAAIGRTTLYEYFPDKEHILIAIAEDEVPGVLEEVVGGFSSRGTAPKRLEKLILGVLEATCLYLPLTRLMTREGPKLSDAGKARVAQAHAALADRIRAIVADGLEKGELEAVDVDTGSRFVLSLVGSGMKTLLQADEPCSQLREVRRLTARALRGALVE